MSENIDINEHFAAALNHMREVQNMDGSMPWFAGGIVDPWNHLEAVMGFHIAGDKQAAQRGFAYLFNSQNTDGSWWGQMGNAVPMDADMLHFTRDNIEIGAPVRDTNFIAYIATAVLHHHLIFADQKFLDKAWPHVKSALDFVIGFQHSEGDIRWTADPNQPDDALLAGCSSIYLSLTHALALAKIMRLHLPDWEAARANLEQAICEKPQRFDRSWPAKTRFSMDWYYPILCGALPPAMAVQRLEARWDEFIIPEYGCRCVNDEPWATAAESAEFILTLMRVGKYELAKTHLAWLDKYRGADGLYYMGYQLEEKIFWPQETPPWTLGAILLAYDAVYALTPANQLFYESVAVPQ